MAIDLGDIPSGTEPTTAEKLQIRKAIGVGTTDAPTFNSVNITTTAAANVFSTSAAALQTSGYLGVARAINLIDTAGISWSSTSTLLGATGTNLLQDAPGILAQRNGTAKQTLRVYNTNLAGAPEWAEFDWITSGIGNTLRIGTNLSGTGAARPIDFVTGGVAKWQISAAGHLMSAGVTDNTYDIGASGANRPKDIHAGNSFAVSGWTLTSTGVSYAGVNMASWNGARFNVGSTTHALVMSGTIFRFNGDTSAFPAIKRNGTGIDIVLANDSAFAPVKGKITTDTNYTAGVPSATGYLTIYDATGTAYRVPCTV